MKEENDPFLWKVGDWFPKWKGGGRFICASTAFPFEFPSRPNFPPQGLFDHPKGGYLRGLYDDVLSSCKGSVGELLAGHFLRDNSWLGKNVSEQ